MHYLSLFYAFGLTNSLIVKRARFAGVESKKRSQVESVNRDIYHRGHGGHGVRQDRSQRIAAVDTHRNSLTQVLSLRLCAFALNTLIILCVLSALSGENYSAYDCPK